MLKSFANLFQTNPRYRYLWLAFFISVLGDAWAYIANVIGVVALSKGQGAGAGFALSLFLVLRKIPPFLLGPVVGNVADSFNKNNVMIVADLGRAAVLFILAFVGSANLWLLLGLITLQSSFSAFFDPARSGLLPSVVGKSQISTAVVLDATTKQAINSVGTAIGGVLTQYCGVTAIYLINAATYAASALTLIRFSVLNKREQAKEPGAELSSTSSRRSAMTKRVRDEDRAYRLKTSKNVTEGEIFLLFFGKDEEEVDTDGAAVPVDPKAKKGNRCCVGCGRFIEGLRFLCGNTFILSITFAKIFVAIDSASNLANILVCQGPFLIPGDVGAATTLGVLYGCVGVGAAIGPILAKRFTKDKAHAQTKTLIIAFTLGFISCECLALLYYFPNSIIFFALNVIRGGAYSSVMVFSTVLLQRLVPNEFIGRILAYDLAIYTLALTIALFLFGFLFDAPVNMNPFIFYAVCGGSFLLGAIFFTLLLLCCCRGRKLEDVKLPTPAI